MKGMHAETIILEIRDKDLSQDKYCRVKHKPKSDLEGTIAGEGGERWGLLPACSSTASLANWQNWVVNEWECPVAKETALVGERGKEQRGQV